jgi:hypothetical protein
MDKDKPLFEIMRANQQKKGLRLPTWVKRLADGSDDPHPHAPVEEGGSAPSPAVAAEQAAAANESAKIVQWAKQPVGFRLPMGLLAGLAIAVVALVVVVFLVALQLGKQTQEKEIAGYETAAAPMRALQEQPVKPLIPPTVEGVEKQASKPLEMTETPEGKASDPRQGGLNYFCLTRLPATKRDELLKAVAFLKANGVDATIVSVNNGGSLKLVALKGFAKPNSDPEAQQYKSQLQALGRKWKAQAKASSDWKDLFPEKYKPGVN